MSLLMYILSCAILGFAIGQSINDGSNKYLIITLILLMLNILRYLFDQRERNKYD